MTLDTKFHAELVSDYTNPLTLESGDAFQKYAKQINLATGTGANQADKRYSATRTLTASSSEDLDLAGSLTDVFGATITLARVKFLLVFAAAANTNNVVVGGASSNAWPGPFGATTHTVAVRPGGLLVMMAPDATGWPVTPATGDLLHVANSAAGTSVTYDVVIIGSSA